ncbi:MAG: hypothetical protein ABIO60_05200 [Aquaticitalea sp.]
MNYTAHVFEILRDTSNTTFNNGHVILNSANRSKRITIPTLFFLFFSAVLSFNSHAQKPVLTDEEVVAETVTKEIDEVFQSQDFLKKKNKKFADVKGSMIVDIGVVQNGKVSTFYKAESDIKNIDFINFMSDYILDHKFKFKLQKLQRYKIRYNIKFN